MVKKIVAIGPESTGKSTLCEALASIYKTRSCPEFAREFLTTNPMKYGYDDLLTIAKGQLALEDELTRKVEQENPGGLLFIDTDMYVMKVWCEYVFGKCHSFILDQIAERKYDQYLLCNTDIPWSEDPLREYPAIEQRNELFNMYKDLMVNQQTPWIIVSGSPEERIRQAVLAVGTILH